MNWAIKTSLNFVVSQFVKLESSKEDLSSDYIEKVAK